MHRRSFSVLVCLAPLVVAAPPSASRAAGDITFRFLDQPTDGDYDLLCPVEVKGDGELRIAFDATDAGQLSYVRLADGKVALYRARGRAAERVGDAQPFNATGQLDVTLQRRADRVRVIAGGQALIDAPWDAPIGGKVGVAGRGGLVPGDPLLQRVAAPLFRDDFTREADEMAGWTIHRGMFRNTMVQAAGAEAQRSANPFSLHVEAEADALATAGYWFWDTYDVSVSVKPRDVEAVGLCAYAQDEQNYVALRWEAGDDDEPHARQLVLVRDGRQETLAEAPGGFVPGQWYRLELRVTPGRVEALIDRDPVLAADTNAFGQGAIGLWLREGEAVFDDVAVAAPDAADTQGPRINPVFLADETMAAQEVFLPRSFWRRGSAPGEYWHWGEFFDDATVTVPLKLLEGDGLGILLRSDARDTVRGYRLTATTANGSVTLDLARNGAPIAHRAEALSGDDPLRFAARGDGLTVSQGARLMLSYTDPTPVPGRKVALLNAPPTAVDLVTVASDHFRDYVFSSGPTDWFAGKGVWEVTTRWPCSPKWTFFGGAQSENPVLWTKHGYSGDIALEFFTNIKMDVAPPLGYSHPSDINATICGDGRSLQNGYSFIFAGWCNAGSAILRNGKIVAQTPDVRFDNPVSGNLSFQRHWFRVRVEKLRNRIRFWVDDRPVLEYTDPAPLPGGRVALWSFHNGLMVARARLWYAREQAASVVRAPAPRPSKIEPAARDADAPQIFNDFEADSGEWQPARESPTTLLELDAETAASGRRSLRITNQDEGGPFAVYAVTTAFRISEWPLLSFDYRLSPEAKVNLYFFINGRWHALKLTAEQPPWDRVPIIGQIPNVQADGRWRHAQFNLLPPLQRINPQLTAFVVRGIALSPAWESYERCGIGGNRRGTRYWIDNFRIGPAQ